VPVIGRLADMVGRKNLYNLGFAVFTLGSLLAGLSQPSLHAWDLVFYRVIQGVGGALLFTNSTAIVTDAFRHGRIGLGLGVNQIASAAGFLLGPVVGGLLTSISWRWVFLVNVPIGLFGTFWGSGLFSSPNTNAIMSSVVPERRGVTAGVRSMLANTGQMLSIAVAFPLVLSRIPQSLMVHVFIYGGGMAADPQALNAFQSGLHEAFLLSFAITLVAAAVSAMRPTDHSDFPPGRGD
jgi:MFS family permease